MARPAIRVVAVKQFSTGQILDVVFAALAESEPSPHRNSRGLEQVARNCGRTHPIEQSDPPDLPRP